jgi:hypothetical protein
MNNNVDSIDSIGINKDITKNKGFFIDASDDS